ncbi:MAG TPA: tetratricopeptide repeat protein, partial [Vicinamibacterales bacterium]|nr:tetratricopeptide repeat protein [Vicinamibacterales bacterium]
RPKSFDVLRYLLENPGRLVSKDELLSAVWRGTIVTEGSVTQCLIEIRRALGGPSQSFVRTIPRRGYIFDAPSSSGIDDALPEPSNETCKTAIGHPARRYAQRVAGLFAACLPVVVVVGALSIAEMKAPPTKAPSSTAVNRHVPAAYEQARFFYARRGPSDIGRAIRLYEDALQSDPSFAPAWVGLAAAYRIQVADGTISREVGASKRQFAVEQALRIDPHLAQAHIEAAKLAWDNGDDRDAREHARKASRSSPEDAVVLAYLANIAAWSGRFDEAIELARRVVSLDPLAAIARNHVANLLLAAGRFEEAKAEFVKQSELNPSAGQDISVAVGFILILERRFDEAFAAIERWPAGDDRNEALAMIGRAVGRNADGDAALQALSSATGLGSKVRLAEVRAFRGEYDEAFHALEGIHADTARDSWSSPDSVWAWQLNFSPFLRPLRADPRWAQVRSSTAASHR